MSSKHDLLKKKSPFTFNEVNLFEFSTNGILDILDRIGNTKTWANFSWNILVKS
jgi:hypothetical protein